MSVKIQKVRVVSNLESIPESTTATVAVRDLVFLHAVMAELNQYFHQPMHYPNDPNVDRYMSVDGGDVHSLIREAYYERLGRMLPKDILERVEDGEFDQPEPPYYFDPDNVIKTT